MRFFKLVNFHADYLSKGQTVLERDRRGFNLGANPFNQYSAQVTTWHFLDTYYFYLSLKE